MVNTPPRVAQNHPPNPINPPNLANVQLDMAQAMDQLTAQIGRLGLSPQVKSIPGENSKVGNDFIQWAGCPGYPVRAPQFAPRFASQFNQRPKLPSPRQPWGYQPMYPRFQPRMVRKARFCTNPSVSTSTDVADATLSIISRITDSTLSTG